MSERLAPPIEDSGNTIRKRIQGSRPAVTVAEFEEFDLSRPPEGIVPIGNPLPDAVVHVLFESLTSEPTSYN